jgi:hypothetical protein
VYEVGRKALGGLPEALSSMSSTRPPAKESPSGAPVAHACNPSYSGGREVGGSRLDATQGSGLRAPISKTHQKIEPAEGLKW